MSGKAVSLDNLLQTKDIVVFQQLRDNLGSKAKDRLAVHQILSEGLRVRILELLGIRLYKQVEQTPAKLVNQCRRLADFVEERVLHRTIIKLNERGA